MGEAPSVRVVVSLPLAAQPPPRLLVDNALQALREPAIEQRAPPVLQEAHQQHPPAARDLHAPVTELARVAAQLALLEGDGGVEVLKPRAAAVELGGRSEQQVEREVALVLVRGEGALAALLGAVDDHEEVVGDERARRQPVRLADARRCAAAGS